MRRFRQVPVVLGVASAFIGGSELALVGGSSASTGSAASVRVIKFFAMDGGARTFGFPASATPKLGDRFVLFGDLYPPSGKKPGQSRLGTWEDMFTVVSKEATGFTYYTGTFILPGGKIFTVARDPEANTVRVAAVIGGTGVYAGARGTLTDHGIPNKPADNLTFRLLP
jgi:hypothetical protein